eukprot:TRINITY_DN12683_c0_g1_i2.p1 TRINITY_DN12683_c0_g1~~TRINITY_DN12683_c0_g1_i2.p1  ORF type:complete len:206 (+),score=80.80 TRINITY_DN12683_c0_g1_i2:191-808(+)
MGIHNYNGGSCVAMSGKGCVAIASDHRMGAQFATISRNNVKVHQVGRKAFVGLAGLETDNQTVLSKVQFRMKLFRLREEREMPVEAVGSMISNMMYEHRFGSFFLHPIIAGINGDGDAYLCGMDSIGAASASKDFMVAGTASDMLFGTCESMWKPDMGPDELFETISQALMTSLDRDCLSGWGCTVKVLTADGKCITRDIKSRMD